MGPVSSCRLDCARTIPSFPPVHFHCAPSNAVESVCGPRKCGLVSPPPPSPAFHAAQSNLLPNTQYIYTDFFHFDRVWRAVFALSLWQVRPLKNRDILIRLRRSNNFQTSQSICALFLFQFFSLSHTFSCPWHVSVWYRPFSDGIFHSPTHVCLL